MPLLIVTAAAGVALTVMLGGFLFNNPEPADDIKDVKELIKTLKDTQEIKKTDNSDTGEKFDIQDVKELIQSLKEIQEIEKTQRDEQKERQSSQVQEYKKGEMEAVITSEMLSNIVSSAVEKAMERQNDEIQEKLDRLSNLEEKIIERLDEHKRREEIPKVDYRPSPKNDKLHQKILQERNLDNLRDNQEVKKTENPDPGEKVDIQDVKEPIQREIQEIKDTQSDEQKERQTSQVQEYKKGEMEDAILVEKETKRKNDENRLNYIEEKVRYLLSDNRNKTKRFLGY